MDSPLLDIDLLAEERITLDDLQVGMTRPATLRGVSMKPLLVGFLGVAVVFLATGNPFYLGLGLPVYLILRWVSADYPRIFAEIAAWVRVNARCRNRRLWGVASFSPRRTNKWEHEDGFI